MFAWKMSPSRMWVSARRTASAWAVPVTAASNGSQRYGREAGASPAGDAAGPPASARSTSATVRRTRPGSVPGRDSQYQRSAAASCTRTWS